MSDGVNGEGLAKVRESLELLRTSCGVCGARLGVDAQLDDVRECVVRNGSCILEGAATTSLLSLSSDIVRPLQFLPSIM